MWSWNGKRRAIFEFHLPQKLTLQGDTCRPKVTEQSPSFRPSPQGESNVFAGFWIEYRSMPTYLLGFASLVINAARMVLHFYTCYPWNFRVGNPWIDRSWATQKNPKLQTSAHWLSHKTELPRLVCGSWSSDGWASLALGLFYKLPHHPVPFHVFVLWVKWSILVVISKTEDLLHSGGVSRICCFVFLLHVYSRSLEDFGVAYGLQH